MSLIGDFATTFGTRSGLTVRIGSLDPAATLPVSVVRFYGGSAASWDGTQEVLAQITCYSTSQATAYTNAETARSSLHRVTNLDLGSFVAGSINCDPLLSLPPMEASGGWTYRAAFSLRMMVKPDAA